MSKQFFFDPAIYRVMSRFWSTDDTRYYLNGFAIQRHPDDGHAQFIATNGRRLGLIDETSIEGPDQNLLVSRCPRMLRAVNGLGRKEAGLMRLDYSKDYAALSLFANGDLMLPEMAEQENPLDNPNFVTGQADCLQDGDFPDWRRSLPAAKRDGKSVNPVGMSFKNIEAFAFDATGRSAKDAIISFSVGTAVGQALVVRPVDACWVDRFTGVLMPVRLGGQTHEQD